VPDGHLLQFNTKHMSSGSVPAGEIMLYAILLYALVNICLNFMWFVYSTNPNPQATPHPYTFPKSQQSISPPANSQTKE
jgi:hypothetical protein